MEIVEDAPEALKEFTNKGSKPTVWDGDNPHRTLLTGGRTKF